MVRFLLWIISCLGVAFWKIGVVCAVVMGNLWTIYFFIVLLYPLYGFICFRFLAFNGLCQALWWGYFVGIIGLRIIFRYFEFDSRLFDVDCMVGSKLSLL